MIRLANWPIARKQALAFATLVALFGGIGYATYGEMEVVERSNATVVRNYRMLDALRTVSGAVAAQQRTLAEYVETALPQALDRHRSERARFDDAFTKTRGFTVNPAQLKREDDLGLLAGLWQREIADREIAAMGRPDGRDQARRIAASDAGMKAFQDKVGEIDAAAHALLTLRQQTADEAFSTMRTLMVGGGVLALGVSLVAGWLLKRGIGTPIQVLTGVMHRLATGDTAVAVPASTRRDEIGRMAAAVQVFKDNALDGMRLEAEAAAMRDAAEAERVGREAERAAAAAAQGAVVSALAAGLERLAAGDLTNRLHQAFGAEYEALRANYNAAVASLEEAMQAIVGSARSVHSGSAEISRAADDLSRRTEQQAASLEETAAALDQITAAVRQTAEGAKEARDVASGTQQDAEHSGQVVREAVAAMGGIEESSNKIGQIIGVIDEIAFQTNLLALNAGVEAARAGDAGRGFAVVASEVRALAQRSAEAAREIKSLIAASARQVDTGVRLVDQTGQSLTRIVEQVAKVSTVVADIANSAQQQATGLQEVNTAVNQMDQVTQQNAAMVEQSTAASHALSNEAEELSRLTARFDLGGRDTVPAAPAGRRPGVLAVKAAAPPPRTATVLKTTSLSGRGGAARKRQPVADADGWEEF